MRVGWQLWLAAAALAKTIDYDALERQWESGDKEDELLSDDELDYKRTGTLEKSEIVFVTLKESAIDAMVPVDPVVSAVSELCATWKHMLMHGGLSVNFYELEAYKVLAGLQHGSRVTDLRDFLLEQHQVQEVTWDQRTYHPKHASKLQAKPQKALKPSNSKLKSKKKRSKKDEL